MLVVFLTLCTKCFPVCFRHFFERVYPPEQRGEFLDTLLNKFSIRFCDTNPSSTFTPGKSFVIVFTVPPKHWIFLFHISPSYSSVCRAIYLYLSVQGFIYLSVYLSVCLSVLLLAVYISDELSDLQVLHWSNCICPRLFVCHWLSIGQCPDTSTMQE